MLADVIPQTFFLGLPQQNVVPMLALCAGCNLNAAPDKIIPLWNTVFAHVVKSAFVCGEVGDKHKFMTEYFLGVTITELFGFG